jgi:DNA topoisomerase-3
VNLLDDREEFAILMKEDVAPAPRTRKGKKKKARAPRKPAREPKTAVVAAAAAAPDEAIENALRSWRLAEAKRHGVPAFRIFSDKTLHALAASRPESAAQLLAIPGIGISIVEKYGAQLYRLLHDRA